MIKNGFRFLSKGLSRTLRGCNLTSKLPGNGKCVRQLESTYMDNVSDQRTYNLPHAHEYSIPTKKVQPSSFLPLVIKGFSCIRPAIQNNMNPQVVANKPHVSLSAYTFKNDNVNRMFPRSYTTKVDCLNINAMPFLGMDMGGTLTKLVFFEPKDSSTKQTDNELLSNVTKYLTKNSTYGKSGHRDTQLQKDNVQICDRIGTLHFIRFPTSEINNFLDLCNNLGMADSESTVCATGGGAIKFKDDFKNAQYPKNPPLAINGFGRIGLSVLMMALEDNVNVVAINEPNAKIEEIACWIKHAMQENEMFGGYAGNVSVKNDNCLDIDGKSIRVYNEKDPEKIKWKELQVEYVIEASGKFTEVETAKKHLAAGVKKVIISGPSKDAPMFIRGVNFDKYKKNMTVVSTASSTTYCAVPLLNIIKQKYGVENCQLTKNVIRASLLDKNAIVDTKQTTPLQTTYDAKEVGIFIPELKGRVTDPPETAVPNKWSFNILLNFSYLGFLRWQSDQRKKTGCLAEETNIFIPLIFGDLINPELISILPVVVDYSYIELNITVEKPVKLEELTCPKLWESEVISYVDEEENFIVKLFNSFNSNTIVKSKNISVNFDKTITIGAETLNDRGYLKCLLDLYNHMVEVDQEKPPPMIP